MAKPATAPITTTPNTPSQGYDASSQEDVGPWVKMGFHNGPLDIHTGRNTGGDFFQSGGTFQQT